MAKVPSVALAGRVIFGMGTESMGVAQSVILTHFFSGGEIAFALALNVTSARIGAILNNWVSPYVSATIGVSAAFLVGLVLCLVCIFCAMELAKSVADAEPCWSSTHVDPDHSTVGGGVKREFWVVACICVAGYSSVLPFTSMFMAFRPAGTSQQSAGQMISVVFMISAVMTPVIGKFVDRFGRGSYVLLGSCLLLSLAHTMYTTSENIIVMIFLGIGYSGLVAAVWPLVPLTVSSSRIGFAYGSMTAMQNLGLTITPLIVCHLYPILYTPYYSSRI